MIDGYIERGDNDDHEHSHHGIINENICRESDEYFATDIERTRSTLIVSDVDLPTSDPVLKLGEFEKIPPKVTLFWTKDMRFHYFHLIGANFLCTFQKYNHIPGHIVYR